MDDIKNVLQQEVPETDISTLSEGAKFIKIERIEELLDELFDDWSTQNFNYFLYKGEGYGNLGISASIEVVIEYTDNGKIRRRIFVGACNFATKAIYPNQHFLATAKSECVKNAASDMGKRLGRALNADFITPDTANVKEANGGVEMATGFENIKLKTNATKIKNQSDKNSV